MSDADLGVMSCNPAIGGLGKGHLVREIDALDGLMGRIADRAGIQFRLLNRTKGPAVQGPRAQQDRDIYRREMRRAIRSFSNVTVVVGEVVDFHGEGQTLLGVALSDKSIIGGRTIVLTTGTFLGGLIHLGNTTMPAGRQGASASDRLAARLRDRGLAMGRLKTGTPPRLVRSTIDWDVVGEQPGDPDPTMFSFLSNGPMARQVACGITQTNAVTHELIASKLSESALFSGAIEGIGPRYCPSIEDKVVRFSEKGSHTVFLEPEGLQSDLVYPNGISTSLPEDVQVAFVRSIEGLQNAVIAQPGYAIEYDYLDPRGLDGALRQRSFENLFLAGQINGTTGYEEAAAQGLVAGLNAARMSRGLEPRHFDRTTSYIGVMIDDLTSCGVTEPYRMFTSRAEFRLTIRADNADQRLTAMGREIGIVGADRWAAFATKLDRLHQAKTHLVNRCVPGRLLSDHGCDVRADGTSWSLYDALRLRGVDTALVRSLCDADFNREIVEQLRRESLYDSYAARQQREANLIRSDAAVPLPEEFSFESVGSLSNELRSKLSARRPRTLAEARRIEGMTPAALAAIQIAVMRAAV
jgi:tRNA uridine 5-carboxymethylaminomethyl modification enzyme